MFTAFSGWCVDFHTPASGWQPPWLQRLINGWKITHGLLEKTTRSQPLTAFSYRDGGMAGSRQSGGMGSRQPVVGVQPGGDWLQASEPSLTSSLDYSKASVAQNLNKML